MSTTGRKPSRQAASTARKVLEECMADGACVEAIIARLALRFETGVDALELADVALEMSSADLQKRDRLERIAELLRHRPDIFATLRETAAAVRHERDEWETDAAVVRRLAAGFDAAATISPAASVQLSSLGDEEKLAAATDEIAAWLERLGFTDRDILDIGCGIGRFERALSHAVHRIVGIDISLEMISVARRRCAGLRNVDLRPTSGLDLADFNNASFDCVLAVDSFPYLVLAGLAERYFEEISRVLKPSGRAALLNYSYRGSPALDRADVHRLAEAHGMQVMVDGEKPFLLWDGNAFLLAASDGTLRPKDCSGVKQARAQSEGGLDGARRQDRHHLCRQGKGSDAGAMTIWAEDKVEETRLCPTRPGKQHTEQCRLVGNRINSDQYHAADRLSQD
ncbi:class I SAM-dependent methyltransferase [Mesorhizobium sp.]|uniref:class I SAM-dependent methyltransferase n=2 Tax=Mesorhizobium sp. TaxID=1871066 RepID=UPI000FE8EAED|nr:class I SAM-dependent methyltransferase [Mesorhizobium sp.]RWK57611.1 MAG: class I SAM-dependent methyltransferase [Mesorhizobium sp.]TIP47341.1 MAG: methyltransferase domain-containing protein [Mesorhizobium sp.]